MTATARAVNVVLVHGGFVDGAGWEGVYRILRTDGYTVSIVQNPTLSLAGDVAATKLVLSAQDRPVILVGHSYGGVVITEAGTDPQVAGLVYIAAFAPDRGESVASLIKDPPPGAPVPPILPPQSGLSLPRQGKVPRVLRGRRGCRSRDVSRLVRTPYVSSNGTDFVDPTQDPAYNGSMRKEPRKPRQASRSALDPRTRKLFKAWGREGGQARAKKLSPAERREQARSAVLARWRKRDK